MAFATASSPANRKPGDNAQTATPPQAQARPRQSPGNAEPPTRARAPACARARQRAPGPQRMPGPRRVLGRKPSSGALTEPSIGLPNVDRAKRQALVALAKPSPQRASPQRTPTPPMHARTKSGLRSVTQAEQRVPAARNRHFCPAAVKRNDSSQTQGQNTRFFALSEGPYADKRQKRPSLTSETAKNRLF